MRNILKITGKSATCNKVFVYFRGVGLALVLLALSSFTTSATAQVRVTLNFTNAPATEVFQEIKNQTQSSVVYNMSDLDLRKTISIKAQNEELSSVLDKILSPLGLTYSMNNNNIVVTKKVAATDTRVITGVVTDSSNEPLVGVSVVVKGTTTGITTGINGDFSVRVTGNDVLSFSYLGYTPKEAAVGNNTTINMVLLEDSKILREVVITALGIEKEAKSLSYHVQQLSADEVTKVPDANFINSLAGKVAGVTINSASSGVGSASRVVMRGAKSISNNNNALYVIDGVPMFNLDHGLVSDRFEGAGQSGDALANINPDDIESISVLSGASAAALYGSAAANGVVLVTTKKGQEGKVTANFTNSTTFSAPLILPKFQNTYGPTSIGSFHSWGDKLTTPSSYSPADFFQMGYSVNNSLNVSMGSKTNQTYISLGNMIAEGIIRNNDYDRINFLIRNTSKLLGDKLTLDLQYSLSNIKEQNMVAQGEYHNPLVAVYLFPPGDDFNKVKAFERYNAERNFATQFWPYEDGLGQQNPYWVTDRELFANKKMRHMITGSLRYEFMKGIDLSGRVKVDLGQEQFERKFHASTSYPLFASETGFYSLNKVDTRQIYGEVRLNIDRYFWDNNMNVVANIGVSVDDVQYDQNQYGGKLAMVPNLFTYSNVDQTLAEPSQTGYMKQKQSAFASVQLGYRSMLYLDVTARNDWASSLAGTNYKSFFYPSVGLSAVITEMLKMDSKLLSYAKLRASYSQVGNEPMHHVAIPTYSVSRGTPSTIARMINPYLKPEDTRAWEVGANLGFFGNKLRIDATAYHSKTYNQIFNVPLAASSGYSGVLLNAGRIDNKGIELAARYGEKWGKFSWNTYLTYSANRNKVVELINENTKNPVNGEPIDLPNFDMGGTGNYKISLTEGGSMGDIYVTTLKVDESGAIYVNPLDRTVAVETDPNRRFIYAGNAAPKHNIGWGNTFGWNGISAGFLISARLGGVVVSSTQAVMDYFGVSQASADAREAGSVLVNKISSLPVQEYYQEVGNPSGGATSMYVYSATNIRLGEVTLGYDIPVSNWTNAIKGLNVSLIGRNLFFLYNKAPFDPETTASTGTYFQGIDHFMQPSLRNIGFSVKLQF